MSTTIGGLNVYATQQGIFDYMVAQIPWEVVDSEIPDAETVTVRMVNGTIKPYVVMRFGDALAASGQNSFGGPRRDGYYSPFQAISVGPSGMKALELASLCNSKLIGYTPDVNSGPITKSFGGGAMAIKGVNTTPSFYVAIAGFQFLTNMQPE